MNTHTTVIFFVMPGWEGLVRAPTGKELLVAEIQAARLDANQDQSAFLRIRAGDDDTLDDNGNEINPMRAAAHVPMKPGDVKLFGYNPMIRARTTAIDVTASPRDPLTEEATKQLNMPLVAPTIRVVVQYEIVDPA